MSKKKAGTARQGRKARGSAPRKRTKKAAEAATKMGRPTKYRPEFVVIAREMCRRGGTDYDLAQEFGVVTSTIWSWSLKHVDFSNALKTEKEGFDDRVERSLAQRAVGYSYHATKVMQHNGVPVYAEYIEHVPPDLGACKLWLTNRRKKDWTDTSKLEHTGKDGEPLVPPAKSDRDLARAIVDIFRSAHNEQAAAESDKPDESGEAVSGAMPTVTDPPRRMKFNPSTGALE
jgi:hypothetical protein